MQDIMQVTNFDFGFTFNSKAISASCQKFQVHKYPQYSGVVERGKEKVDIFTLYEVEDKKFFWFELPEKREDLAKEIESGLKKYISKN